MLTYTYGGKKGKTISVKESNDLVVVRSNENLPLENLSLSEKSRSLSNKLMLMHAYPEANIRVYRCNASGDQTAKQIRNQVRKDFKLEKDIAFAGRVLVDNKGNLNLYTENIFIKFNDDIAKDKCLDILEKSKLTVKQEVKYAKNGFFVKAKEGIGHEVFEIANTLLKSKDVELCHPEIILQKRKKSIYKEQWHLKKTKINNVEVDAHVDVQNAWNHTKGAGVTIAVIDDGIDIDHPEFSSQGKIVAPKDMNSNSADPRPKYADEKHGTACAGVACADGSSLASGVAPDSSLMPIRLRAGLGSRWEADAFVWAADNGADVISCSWGPPDGTWWDPGDPTHTSMFPLPDSSRLAINYAAEQGRNGKGCIITWAAGNGRENTFFDGYADYDKVMAIAACNDTSRRSVYSDFGESVLCCFPSSDQEYPLFNNPKPLTSGIWTTDIQGNGGYSVSDYANDFGGTSSACPGAAGVIALMLSINPNLLLDEVKELVRISCDKIDPAFADYDMNGHSIYYGYGRLNANLAVHNAMNTLQLTQSLSLDGYVTYKKVGAVSFSGKSEISSSKKNDRITGLALQISPKPNDLDVAYRLVYNNIGATPKFKNGEYASKNDRRRMVIGLAVKLEGSKASEYNVEYSALLDNKKKWISGANGSFCGTGGGKGPAIEKLKFEISKK